MKNKNSPQFFCEHCGAEVEQNARVCKKCGKFFSEVRCPICGLTGNVYKFAKGCPACGYAFSGKPDADSGKTPAAPGDSLPVWLYILCGGALIALLAAAILSGLR